MLRYGRVPELRVCRKIGTALHVAQFVMSSFSVISGAAEEENHMNDQTIQTFDVRRIGEISVDGHEFNLWIDEPYRRGLRGLAEFSHVIITWWAHETPNQEPAETLIAHETPYLKGPENVGVFSTRSPQRPNRLGISVCAIASIDEQSGMISLGWIDALNETPVVDLKPYFPSSDRVRDAETPDWCAGWPACLEDSASFAWETVLSEF